MKKVSVLGKSLLQTGVGLLIFSLLLMIALLIIFSLRIFLGVFLVINKEDLNLIAPILATIGTALYIYNSNKLEKEMEDIKKQVDLLGILSAELEFLGKNLISYKETFSKAGHYPFYELWNVDVSIYFNGLSHKINNFETIALKKDLMMIKDKLLVIRNMELEAKKSEEERGTEKLIRIKIESLRRGIINIINDELFPILEKYKNILDSPLLK